MNFRQISLIGLVLPLTVFAQNPEILGNAQGWAQKDLSIRGSSYTGAGISINDLNLKAPYSAHYNEELPFPADLLSAPETKTGLDNASGHPVGTVAYNIVPQADTLTAGMRIGTRERYQASLSGQAAGIGVFAEGEQARRIDYDANGLDRFSAGAYLQHEVSDWQLDVIGGHQQKEFGAQGYFGIPSDVYAEERLDDTLILASATRGDLDDSFMRATAAWRQFDNRYRIPVSNYVNDVQSGFGAVVLEGRTIEIQNIALNLRGDVEHEQIDGDIGTHDRTRGAVLILPQFTYEHFRITAGLNSVFQSDESAEWLPQAGIEWFATDNSTLYASYSESVQQPDFQMLYSSGPFQAGNSALHMQRSQKTELGVRQFTSASLDWRAAVFHRRLENASDWVANTATDLGTVNVSGLESEISYYPSDELKLRAFYQWIHKDDTPAGGLYETDYPEHVLYVSGYWQLTPEFTLFIAQHLRQQTANTARTSSDFGADASVGLHWFPHFANNARLSFAVENLWDSDFQAIPGLKPAGQTVSTGITVTW